MGKVLNKNKVLEQEKPENNSFETLDICFENEVAGFAGVVDGQLIMREKRNTDSALQRA